MMTFVTRIVFAVLILVCAGLSVVIIPPLALASAVILPLVWAARRIAWVLAKPERAYPSSSKVRGADPAVGQLVLRPRITHGGPS
jgi:hypothetical protein